jgi:hypothetical protein
MLLLFVAGSAFSITVNGTVQPNLELNSSNPSNNNIGIVNAINDYNVKQTILNTYYQIEEMANEKIWFEFHIGFGENTFFSTNKAELITHNYLSNPYSDSTNYTSSFNGNLLLKVNLFNPKLPYATTLISRMDYLQELVDQYGLPLSADAATNLAKIRKTIEDYNSEFWYKRVSLGLGIPFNPLPNTSYNNNSTSLAGNIFHVEDTFVFVGYDLGDFATIELGANVYLNRIFLGASFDVSTPSYQLSAGFVSLVKSLFGVPSGTTIATRTLY